MEYLPGGQFACVLMSVTVTVGDHSCFCFNMCLILDPVLLLDAADYENLAMFCCVLT